MNYPYSVALWTRPSSVEGAVLVHLSTQPDGTGWCVDLIGLSSIGQIVVTAWTGGSGLEIVGPVLGANVWTHVVTTFSPTNGYRLYLNGTYYNSLSAFTYEGAGGVLRVTLGNGLQAAPHAWWGGCHSQSIVPDVYYGSIDQFSVYSRELSSSEISSLANPSLNE